MRKTRVNPSIYYLLPVLELGRRSGTPRHLFWEDCELFPVQLKNTTQVFHGVFSQLDMPRKNNWGGGVQRFLAPLGQEEFIPNT